MNPKLTQDYVALIGNPNCGKTAIFNHLTGLNQKVSNYPGITVERKIGRLRFDHWKRRRLRRFKRFSDRFDGKFNHRTARKFKRHHNLRLNVLDLPGTYSLTAYSMDEVVARDYIIEDRPDVVINIIDATNLERNLYLTTQLMELDIKLVIALNMYDLMESRGDILDLKKLENFLEIPIVKTVGNTGEGVDQLLNEIVNKVIFSL